MWWPFRRVSVPVRPAPLDATAIVRRARRLRFRVAPGAVSQLSGAYHGARPGVGLTFAELRAYEPGDDVRHIDWNVTARQGRPFVRRFVEERALTLWLVVDVSASMRFGAERATKADRAAQAAALLATAAVQNGDRVGLVLVSDRIELELAPAGGVRHLSQLVRALVATPTTSPSTKLSIGLARVRRTARRAMLVVVSDFISEEPSFTWRRAARRHDTIALRVVDPRENELPASGLDFPGGCRARNQAHRGFELAPAAKELCRGRRRSHPNIPALVRQFRDSGFHDDDRHGPDRAADRALFAASHAPRCAVSEPTARSLVPPRPNLGPETWPKTVPLAGYWIALSIASAVLIAWALWRFVRRGAARPGQGALAIDSADVTPRGRLVALSTSTKNALATRFGPTWRAKTTEELAAEPALSEMLGPEPFQELIQFLDRIDRLKFAPERPNQHRQSLQEELADWNPRIAGLITKIQAKPNGRHVKRATRSAPAATKTAGRKDKAIPSASLTATTRFE